MHGTILQVGAPLNDGKILPRNGSWRFHRDYCRVRLPSRVRTRKNPRLFLCRGLPVYFGCVCAASLLCLGVTGSDRRHDIGSIRSGNTSELPKMGAKKPFCFLPDWTVAGRVFRTYQERRKATSWDAAICSRARRTLECSERNEDNFLSGGLLAEFPGIHSATPNNRRHSARQLCYAVINPYASSRCEPGNDSPPPDQALSRYGGGSIR